MNLKLIAPPRGEPVGIEEAKRYLRVDTDDDFGIIENLIKTARETVEHYTGKTLITQTWRMALNSTSRAIKSSLAEPAGTTKSFIKLPGNPFIRLEGNPKLISPGSAKEIKKYHVVYGFSQAMLGVNLFLNEDQSLQVDCVCGYGDISEDVPQTFRQAILMLTAELYENRSGQNAHPSKPAFINDAVACLLQPLRSPTVI